MADIALCLLNAKIRHDSREGFQTLYIATLVLKIKLNLVSFNKSRLKGMTKGTRTWMRVFCMASSYFSSKKLSYYVRTVAG
jgi:hypothetical protein